MVLEALARRIAQALHALGDLRVGVALAVVAVLGQIAQEIGIGTAGLQQLLRHRVHLLEAVVAEDDVQIGIGRDGMIDLFFGQLAGWASATPRWSGSGFTRLVVELGDLPGHPARAIARRAKAASEAWLAERLAGARVARPRERAREVMLLMEGSMALMLIHGDRSYIDAAARAARQLVRQR